MLHTPLGQSRLDKHPTQVLLAGSQTGRIGSRQSTLVEHCTQVCVVGLHTVSGPLGHCVLFKHSTHWPRRASHTRPDGHVGFCAEQPGTHALFAHTIPGPQ